MKKFILISISAFALAGAGYFLICNYTFSQGTRTGYLLKFSQRGYLFKTYEGEINSGLITTTASGALGQNLWQFSVPHKMTGAIEALNKLEGKQVRLTYRQIIKPMPWQGDSDCLVESVEEVK